MALERATPTRRWPMRLFGAPGIMWSSMTVVAVAEEDRGGGGGGTKATEWSGGGGGGGGEVVRAEAEQDAAGTTREAE